MSPTAKKFVCRRYLCGREFLSKQGYDYHLLRHKETKGYSCELCPSKFFTSNELSNHNRSVHIGERPFGCSQCSAKFKFEYNLRIHSRIHTGERPHVCDECGRGFTARSAFLNHKRLHTGERPYECSTCHKKFPISTTLRIHERTHLEQRPHVCAICGKGYTTKYNLKLHKKQKKHYEIVELCAPSEESEPRPVELEGREACSSDSSRP